MNIKKLIYLTVILSLFRAPCAAEELRKVSFVPQWAPQAQFAGYYVAYELGFYRKYGLDVEILPGGPEVSPAELLRSSKATFANMGLNTAIQEFSQNSDIVNIAQIAQKSALMFVAKKSSGIKKINDINGKKVGVWNGISRIQSMSFLKKHNLTVEILPQSYSIDLFLRGGIDVASAMWYNEYYMILNSGYDPDELVTFFFSDEASLNFPEDGIYTLAQTFANDETLCCNFVKATMEGWRYSFAHPEEALDIVLKYMRKAHISANRMHQKWMLEKMKDIILVGAADKFSGKLALDDYNRVAENLREYGLIKKVPDFNAFSRPCAEK